MSQLNYYTYSDNNIHKNMIIYHWAFSNHHRRIIYLAPASPRLVIHNTIMQRHPNLMHLLIFCMWHHGFNPIDRMQHDRSDTT